MRRRKSADDMHVVVCWLLNVPVTCWDGSAQMRRRKSADDMHVVVCWLLNVAVTC